MSEFKKKYIGDADFYKYVLAIVLPMIVQNLVTNFVSMLDNIMVGQVGTAQMSGVSIVNQLIFVFNITVFGAVSGAGIFGTQYFGKGDHEGQKYTFRYRVFMIILVIVLGILALQFFGQELIRLFLSEDDAPEMVAATLNYGMDYLRIIIWSLIPFGLGQVYASIVRECGETRIPMLGSFAAIGVNLVLDYGLIFGKLGMPYMGVAGAALATVIAKWIEALVVIIWAHCKKEKNKYLIGAYKSFYIPGKLFIDITIKGFPLLMNEFLWSVGMSVIAQAYSTLGLEVVAARNIASTLTNMFNVVFIQLGASIGIIVGAKLGANRLEEAKDADRKLIFFSVASTVVIGALMIPVAYSFPSIYNTEQTVKELSSYIIVLQAVAMPLWAYTHACYFTLRSGGKTGVTFLFDFVFTWAVMIPLAFILTRFTTLGSRTIIFIITYSEAIKVVVGYYLIKSGVWINNIVGDKAE